jgi:peptidoglycan hydrolase CwlO-like protein
MVNNNNISQAIDQLRRDVEKSNNELRSKELELTKSNFELAKKKQEISGTEQELVKLNTDLTKKKRDVVNFLVKCNSSW